MTAIALLRKAVMVEGSQAAVARKIGCSPATVCRMLNNNYTAGTEAIERRVQAVYGGKVMTETMVPDGYKLNAAGHLVPLDSIKEIDLARDEFVAEVVSEAEAVSYMLGNFKKKLGDNIQAFLELSAEKYGADLGGARGNLNLTSFDGRFKVCRCVADRIEFNEQLQAAKALVDECLREWTKAGDPRARAVIEQAFQTDKKGNINIKRILGLRQLRIEDDKWLMAMKAIGDAVTITGSCVYYRVYKRDDAGEYQQIPLDFSAV